jgi:hypothetical protein
MRNSRSVTSSIARSTWRSFGSGALGVWVTLAAPVRAEGTPADSKGAVERPGVSAPLPAAAPGAAPGPTAASSGEPSPGASLRLGGYLDAARDALGRSCIATGVAWRGSEAYVACGSSGLWVVVLADTGFSLRGTYDVGGVAKGLAEIEGKIWVQVSREVALPLDDALRGAAATALPNTPVGPVTSGPSRGTRVVVRESVKSDSQESFAVVSRGIDGVVIDGGSEQGVREGQKYELLLDGKSRESWVGVVRTTWDDEAFVQFGNNEPPTTVTRARATTREVTRSWIAPPRIPHLWELQIFARPYLPVNPSGFGVLGEASLGYRFQNVHLWGEVNPIGFGTTNETVGTIGAQAFVAYDSQFFEIGLGAGAQTVNTPDLSDNGNPPGTGLAVAMMARVGSPDGLYLQMQATEALFHQQFEFTEFRFMSQIPLSTGYWIQVRGAGGPVGYALAEGRLRVRVSGNGTAGSFFLHGAGGMVGVFRRCGAVTIDNSSCQFFTDSHLGPHVGIGGEWRF